MRKYILFLFLAGIAFSQTVQQSDPAQLGANSGNWSVEVNWTGGAGGAVPAYQIQRLGPVQGYFITQVETSPGSPAPTNGYNLTLTDSSNADVMTGQGLGLSSTSAQTFQVSSTVAPLNGALTVNISGQNVANAKGQILIYFTKPANVNLALLRKASGGTILPSPSSPLQYLRTAPNLPGLPFQWNTFPTAYAADYNFPAQAASGPLTGGVLATYAMTPCPLGLNGGDANHWLYLSGGTGTAEPVVITNGTCTSGAATGTIQFTPANNHSGAWTIQSATGGLQEAIQGVSSTGGAVLCAGTTVLFAHPVVPSNVTLGGLNYGACTIQVGASQWPSSISSPPWRVLTNAVQSLAAITTVTGASNVVMSDFTVDMNGANQSNFTGAGAVSLDSTVNSTVQRVKVINQKQVGQAFAAYSNTGTGNSFLNNIVKGFGTAISTCSGGYFVQIPGTVVDGNYADGLCDEAYIANGPGDYGNTFSNNRLVGNPNATGVVAYHDEDASNNKFIGNHCEGPVAACYNIAPSGSSGSSITDVQMIGNLSISNASGSPGVGMQCGGDAFSHTASFVTLSDNIIYNSGNALAVNCANSTVTGNIVRNSLVGLILNTGATNVQTWGNVFVGNTNAISHLESPAFPTYVNATDDSSNSIANWGELPVALVNGANNNVAIGSGTVVRFAGPTGVFNVTGFANGSRGRLLYVWNQSGQQMTISNNNVGSLAANRISTNTGADVTLRAGNSAATFFYDPDTQQWILLSTN